ncbi:response regulator [uncultured Roseobacter sp.]|uniref:response regulator n=1 Tax=uncultured Roseobacter sp. TaxID=114847 RepID=UPI002628BB6F|nr:response regulator [uncultured Roseobacter sp.]
MQSEPLSKILLVDDDRVTNMLHERLIGKSGVARSVAVATDGVAALEHLESVRSADEEAPDLILLDINMPRMNGFEFLEAYRDLPSEEQKRHMIVMLSTSVLQRDHARAEADPNVHAFVSKPLDRALLNDIVAACQAGRSDRAAG